MWIPITLAAATFQILRTSRQHQLRSVLSVNGAGFVRYAYGFPIAVIVALVTFGVVGEPIPAIPARFWPIIAGAGVVQILGTVALLRAFDLRNFAIGTVYAKTEVILVAIVSAIALGEPLEPLGWVAAFVCMAGVVWLAAPNRLRDVLGSDAGHPAHRRGESGSRPKRFSHSGGDLLGEGDESGKQPPAAAARAPVRAGPKGGQPVRR